MVYENINFKYPNMCVTDGYFYMFDSSLNTLVKKVDDGGTAFMYPTSNAIGGTIISAEYGGGCFWTLQGSSGNYTLKKWITDDYICDLNQSILIVNSASHTFTINTFALENYTTFLSTTVSGGHDFIELSSYSDSVISGTECVLGPNVDGLSERCYAVTVSGNTVFLNSAIENDYAIGDGVSFYTNLWLFNNLGPLGSATGSLYKLNPYTQVFDVYYVDTEYNNITAACFATNNAGFDAKTPSIVYVKGTNLKFMDVNDLSNVSIMTMDNIRINGTTVITVEDISIYNDIAFRLQHEGTYYGTNNSWTNYNYQVSPIRKFIDSISVGIEDKILNSDGVSITEVIAVVSDQYNTPIVDKPVIFEDDNDTGYMLTSTVYTKSNGVANSYYRSGTVPAHVTITVTVTQND